jgi:hypothetical protein
MITIFTHNEYENNSNMSDSVVWDKSDEDEITN